MIKRVSPVQLKKLQCDERSARCRMDSNFLSSSLMPTPERGSEFLETHTPKIFIGRLRGGVPQLLSYSENRDTSMGVPMTRMMLANYGSYRIQGRTHFALITGTLLYPQYCLQQDTTRHTRKRSVLVADRIQNRVVELQIRAKDPGGLQEQKLQGAFLLPGFGRVSQEFMAQLSGSKIRLM